MSILSKFIGKPSSAPHAALPIVKKVYESNIFSLLNITKEDADSGSVELPYTQNLWIDADTAEAILKDMRYNRKIKPSNLNSLEYAMENAKYKERTGTPFIFDKNGTLIDGQHRLTAFLNTSRRGTYKPYLFVTISISGEEDTYKVADRNKIRTLADDLAYDVELARAFTGGKQMTLSAAAGIAYALHTDSLHTNPLKGGAKRYLSEELKSISGASDPDNRAKIANMHNGSLVDICQEYFARTSPIGTRQKNILAPSEWMGLIWHIYNNTSADKELAKSYFANILHYLSFEYDGDKDDIMSHVINVLEKDLYVEYMDDRLLGGGRFRTVRNMTRNQRMAVIIKGWNLYTQGKKKCTKDDIIIELGESFPKVL